MSNRIGIKGIRSSLYQLVNSILGKGGMQIGHRIPPRRNLSDLLGNLFSGTTEAYVIDVGASIGNFAAQVLELVPQANLVCVEPIKRHHAHLKDRFKNHSVILFHTAVGDKDGETVFHETKSQDCSSILQMEQYQRDFPGLGSEVDTYTVPINRLDTFTRQISSPDIEH